MVVQAEIYRVYACMISRLSKMPKNSVLSLQRSGLVNGVETHVPAGRRVHGLFRPEY